MLIRAGKDSQNSNVQTKIAKQNFSRPRGPPRATPHGHVSQATSHAHVVSSLRTHDLRPRTILTIPPIYHFCMWQGVILLLTLAVWHFSPLFGHVNGFKSKKFQPKVVDLIETYNFQIKFVSVRGHIEKIWISKCNLKFKLHRWETYPCQRNCEPAWIMEYSWGRNFEPA